MDYSNVCHLASLTDKEILVELLVAIKKLGGRNEAQQWILGTSKGRDTFVQLGKLAVKLKLSPEDWPKSLKQVVLLGESSICINRSERECLQSPAQVMSTGELLDLALEQMGRNSHFIRLSKAVQMNLKSEGKSAECSISVRSASALVKASVEDQNTSLQKHVIQILLETLHNIKYANVFAAVQLPILQRFSLGVLIPAIQSNGLDLGGLSELFVENTTSVPKRRRSTCNELKMLRFVEAAGLARRGNQMGSKHGCVICIPRHVAIADDTIRDKIAPPCDGEYEASTSTNYDVVVGRGWNHNVLKKYDCKGGKKRMIHSEVHAVADTIRTFGEDVAFDRIFPFAEIIIMELHKDSSYDNAPPCPKCDTLLRAVGICKACHSTDRGSVEHLSWNRSNLEFLDRETVRIPLRTVCNELGVRCRRLSEAEERVRINT